MAEQTSPALIYSVRKILMIMVAILLFILVLVVTYEYFILPRIQIGQILLESTLDLPSTELLALGGLTGKENYISVNEEDVRQKFEASPLIRKAYVEKQFPGTLKIVLYARNPLGIAVKGTSVGRHPYVFDEYGVVFRYSGPSGSLDLPVITGLATEEKNGVQVVPHALLPLLKDLKTLQVESPLLYKQISEISLSRDKGILSNIRLYISSYKLPVVLASGLNENLMKKILLVLDSLKADNMMKDLEYADFRTEQVVLITREGK